MRSLQPSKENIQLFKTCFFLFMRVVFARLDSNPDTADQYRCATGSGSKILPFSQQRHYSQRITTCAVRTGGETLTKQLKNVLGVDTGTNMMQHPGNKLLKNGFFLICPPSLFQVVFRRQRQRHCQLCRDQLAPHRPNPRSEPDPARVPPTDGYGTPTRYQKLCKYFTAPDPRIPQSELRVRGAIFL